MEKETAKIIPPIVAELLYPEVISKLLEFFQQVPLSEVSLQDTYDVDNYRPIVKGDKRYFSTDSSKAVGSVIRLAKTYGLDRVLPELEDINKKLNQ
jgi:hypothetical protein